jgi:hypothetical protein
MGTPERECSQGLPWGNLDQAGMWAWRSLRSRLLPDDLSASLATPKYPGFFEVLLDGQVNNLASGRLGFSTPVFVAVAGIPLGGQLLAIGAETWPCRRLSPDQAANSNNPTGGCSRTVTLPMTGPLPFIRIQDEKMRHFGRFYAPHLNRD